MEAKYKINVGSQEFVEMTGNPDRLDEIVAVMAAYGSPTTSEERMIRKIARYMQAEKFGMVHLVAILRIVVNMNSNEAAEAEVLEFADLLRKDVARIKEAAVAALQNQKDDGGHVWHECDDLDCMICNGGLSLCIVCGQGEGSLEDVCPGERVANG